MDETICVIFKVKFGCTSANDKEIPQPQQEEESKQQFY